jgi:hypothetical protein
VASLTYYLQGSEISGWEALHTTTAAAATTATGWIVSTGATNHSEMEQGVERAATTFLTTLPPDGSLDGILLNDAMRIVTALTGDFASANWVAHFVVRAVTNGGAQDGRIRFRLFKADADGSNATEITSGHQQCSIVTNVSTSADFDSTLTFNPGAFNISNQYLFFQIAWERTGAGGMTSADILFRTGSSSTVGTRITTSDFTTVEAHSGTASLSGGGSVTPAQVTARNAVTALSNGGAITPVVATARNVAALLSGGGSIVYTQAAQRSFSSLLSSGGGITFAGATQRNASPALSNGGSITSTGEREEGTSPEEHTGAAALSGGGAIASTGATDRLSAQALTSGGAVTVEALAGRQTTVTATNGGAVASTATTLRQMVVAVTSGGAVSVLAATVRQGLANLFGGGAAILSALTARFFAPSVSGGGLITSDGGQTIDNREGTASLTMGGSITVQDLKEETIRHVGALLPVGAAHATINPSTPGRAVLALPTRSATPTRSNTTALIPHQ